MEDQNFIDNLMGFNPSELNVFKPVTTTSTNDNIYKTNVTLSKAEDEHYRSRIRVIYNPFDVKNSVIPSAKYAMRDQDGFFMVDTKLVNGDRSCPIFKLWKKFWFSNDEDRKAWAKEMFQKNESQYVLVQIIEDINQPELEGRIMIWKLPKTVWVKMSAKLSPADAKKQPQPLMDYLLGSILDIDVTPGPDDKTQPDRKVREMKYDLSEFDVDAYPIIKTDKTPLFTEDQLEVIEKYATLKIEIFKAKSEKIKATKTAEAMELVPKMKGFYEIAQQYLEENALNIVDEVGYKDWDETTAARVNAWLARVEKMENPTVPVGPITFISEPEAEVGPVFNEGPVETTQTNDLPF